MKGPSLVFILFFSVFQTVFAQSILDQTVQINQEVSLVSDLLQALQQEEIALAYSPDMIPDEKIQVKAGKYALRDLLKKLRRETNVGFRVSGTLIILSHEERTVTLSGKITDSKTGEALIGAVVMVDKNLAGTVTNTYGFYSITLPAREYSITFSYVGYEPVKEKIDLQANSQYRIGLTEKIEELDEVTVSSLNPDYNISNLIPGVTPVHFGEDWPIPYFLGEQDIFQNSLTLPGIRSIGEDATGLNIRGGDIDQNLILLDEAPIYNPNHFYGLISVFNPEVVNNVDIMKGHIPAQFGGRASSVINITQREGNNQQFHASGGIGLVSGRLTLEGPLEMNKSSYIISARRSLINFSVEDFVNEALDESRTSFHDVNAKFNFHLNENNRVFLSAYHGRDRNRAGFDAIRKWGNRSVSVRWNRIFSPRLFSNFTGVISDYNYQIQDPQEVGSFIGKSLIRNLSFKADFGYLINPENTVDFGIHNTIHRLKPGERKPFDENASTNEVSLDNEDAIETAFYMSHQSAISDRLSVHYGLRWSLLQNFGPKNEYIYSPLEIPSDQSIVDTLVYKPGRVFNRQLGWEPRLSANFKLNARQSIKASYTKNYQFIHLISNTVSPSPTDIWKLSDRHIAPTISTHYSFGYYTNSSNDKWEFNVEVYYKDIENIIEFKDGADLLFNENLETELLSGKGRSVGTELFLKKNSGKLRGWISYTLSQAEQKFANRFEALTINDGRFYPTDFDKRHDFSFTSIYSLSPRVSISQSFSYSSGRPVTLPVGKFIFDDKIVPHFENRNLNRLPDYHRMDLSLRWEGRNISKRGKVRRNTDYWVFTLYNVYARKNVYSYFFRESEVSSGQTEAIPYSIFGTVIPSVTYNFRF